MKKTLFKSFLIACAFALTASAAEAQLAGAGANNDEFSDVWQLLSSMSPEQRTAVFEEAGVKEQDLKKLSPDQLDALDDQLHNIAGTIEFGKIDPDKLNTDKIKSTQNTMGDLNTYQQKYDQGKINNAVIKPRSPDAQ
jgi:hypothetical protein